MKRQELYNKCLICDKLTKTTEYRRNKRFDKFCSKRCFYDSRIGKKQKPETIAKRVAKNTGKRRTQELKDRMSKKLKGVYTGELASGYIDGRTTSQKYLRQRDKKYKLRRRAAGDITVELIQRVYEDNIKKYGTLTCHYCVEPISFGKDQLEHKTPISRGGTNHYNNLVIACKSCNCSKNTKTEAEFIQWMSA